MRSRAKILRRGKLHKTKRAKRGGPKPKSIYKIAFVVPYLTPSALSAVARQATFLRTAFVNVRVDVFVDPQSEVETVAEVDVRKDVPVLEYGPFDADADRQTSLAIKLDAKARETTHSLVWHLIMRKKFRAVVFVQAADGGGIEGLRPVVDDLYRLGKS